MENKSDISLLVEAARLYYQHGFSQQEVAQKLGISRPGISRLLNKAREMGIVKIEIRDPLEKGTRLEESLKKKFNLKRILVVPEDNRNAVIKRRLGQAAVRLLDELVEDNLILGVSWGTTMQEVARHVKPKYIKNMLVVQLNGGVSKAAYDTHASEIAQSIGEKFQAIPFLLPLPAIVDSAQVKEAITSDKNIARTLDIARKSTVSLYTIGLFDENSVLVKADYFEREEVQTLIKKGAIGDICSRIIDANGKICQKSLNERTIGIELDDLVNKSYAVAIAGGKEKLPAIRAALNGKWFNCLITDEWIASELNREDPI
jgi:deoxyribonucleoside regulator